MNVTRQDCIEAAVKALQVSATRAGDSASRDVERAKVWAALAVILDPGEIVEIDA